MDHSEAAESQAVERYLLGEMDKPETEAFETHFFACPVCAEEVQLGALLHENGRAVARETPAPGWIDRLRAWLRQPMFVAPAFAALVLAVVAGYQAQEIARLNQPQWAPSYTLRAAARGTAQTIPADRRFVELNPDLRDTSFPQYRWELYDASGKLERSASGIPPNPGAPLSVVVPPGLAPGKYVLKVWGIRAGKPELLDEYPFEAVKP